MQAVNLSLRRPRACSRARSDGLLPALDEEPLNEPIELRPDPLAPPLLLQQLPLEALQTAMRHVEHARGPTGHAVEDVRTVDDSDASVRCE